MGDFLLYHGNDRWLNRLFPQKPVTRAGNFADTQTAVYATDTSRKAIAFAIRKLLRGEELRTFIHSREERLIVVRGEIPSGGTLYVHTLSSQFFVPVEGEQWICTRPVFPLRVERQELAQVRDCVRYASASEINQYWTRVRAVSH